MAKVTRTFENCEDLFEVIVAAHRRHENIRVYIPNEISLAVKDTKEAAAPIMETKETKDDFCLLLSFQMPGQEKMNFNVDAEPQGVYEFSVDFSKESDRYQDDYCRNRYCGMY